MRLRIAATWLSLAACALTSAGQQTEPEPLPEIFDEIIDVRVVNLEVVVTNRRGERVSGLSADDFELWVDGREEPLDYFSEIREGRAETEASEVDALPGLDEGARVGTNYLVYVDDNHTLFHVRRPFVENLIHDLRAMRPQDSMAIVAHQGTGLEMLSPWSSDTVQLEQALRRLLDKEDFGGALRSTMRNARAVGTQRGGTKGLRDVGDDGVGFVDDNVYNESAELAYSGLERFRNFAARQSQIELELAVAGATSTLRSFAQPEGRKVMVLLAGDWPLGAFRGESLTFQNDLEITQPLIETANLLGYTLYPIWSSKTTDVWRSATLGRYANRSGGRALFEATSFFEEVVSDTSSYYWLGFSPNFVGDDARHDIQIRVRAPGLQVRSRSDYVDMSRSAQLTMMAQSSLFFDRRDTPSPVRLEFGEPKRWGMRKMDVPLAVYVPLDRLTTVPVRGEQVARIELRLAIVDSNGQQSKIPTIPITLRGEQRQGDYFRYQMNLHMRRRPHDLVVAVHDPISGKTMNARAEVSFRTGGIVPVAETESLD